MRKLALYARGKERVELDDVLAVVADASALGARRVIDAAFAGKPAEVETRIRQGAQPAGTIAGAAFSRALCARSTQLHKMRLAVDDGDSRRRVRSMRGATAGAFQPRRSGSAAALRDVELDAASRGAMHARSPTRCSNAASSRDLRRLPCERSQRRRACRPEAKCRAFRWRRTRARIRVSAAPAAGSPRRADRASR